ncbi:MAG: UDP-3-O-(3-hydroxymyristoyl)glucosamine N-acyltransferase, partial [Pseudomonadota bacterium]
QVQVGHNVVMGCHCVVAGCTGISGSVTMGDYVTLGGHVGLRDGLTIGSGASIAGKAGVGEDVPPGAQYAGLPAMDARRFISERRALMRLTRKAGGGRTGGDGGAQS